MWVKLRVDWTPTLAPVAEAFITASSNALNLTAYLTNIRTVAGGPAKRNFVAAIETMRQVGELAPVLANFSLADHAQLRTLLTTAPFAANAAYDQLRQDARTAEWVADIEHRRTTHAGNFRTWFSGICNGHDNDAKRNLVNALDSMGYAGTLQTALASLTRTQHDELNNLLTDPLFANAYYDPMRNSAKKALWANYMDTVSRNDAAAFNTWIHDICTGANAGDKKSLVEALEVMRDLNTFTPALASLTPTRHAELRAVLTAAPFAANAAYNQLRQDARTAEVATWVADLEHRRTTHAGNFRTWFSGICNGHDNDAKQNLIDALDSMGFAGTLQTALASLTRTQHDELNNLLTTPLFVNAHYDYMRNDAKKALWANHMDTLSRNNAAAFNTWIHNICTRVNAGDKKSLVEALEVMRGLNTFNPVLANLVPARHAELRAVLTAAPFAGDANYNNLRQAARTAELTALAADLNQLRRRDVNAFRDWIRDICNDRNLLPKFELMNTLEFMRQQGNLRDVLRDLSLGVCESLQLMVRDHDPTGHYQHLRNEIRNQARDIERERAFERARERDNRRNDFRWGYGAYRDRDRDRRDRDGDRDRDRDRRDRDGDRDGANRL